MRILVTGSSGLIGRRLCSVLEKDGHAVSGLVRRPVGKDEAAIRWDPHAGQLEGASLEGFDAVIHLAGAGIADRRWTAARKKVIRDSRVEATRLLADRLAQLQHKPQVLLSGSAIGWYGNRGDAHLDESSERGAGFLPDLCDAWETATAPARKADIRVALLRTGIVLSAGGGALARMLPPFRMGAGGPVGSGRQVMSWISLDDEVGAIHHLLKRNGTEGAYNLTAPQPVTNGAFARTLGKALGRPSFAPLPSLIVRLLFGEMGQALLLEGQHVEPARLLGSGYCFKHPSLESALRAALT